MRFTWRSKWYLLEEAKAQAKTTEAKKGKADSTPTDDRPSAF